MNPRYEQLLHHLRSCTRVVDLGCGNNPVAGATVAVDCHLDPLERSFGHGAVIEHEVFAQRGIQFVNHRIDQKLPFADKEFDFAYSAHAFEHVDDPRTACLEMMRIAKAGAIVAPSVFAEHAFGRPYHKWLMMERGNRLFFFLKRPDENCPFGDHPEWDPERGWHAVGKTNPFDILLNDGEWYKDREGPVFDRLQRLLRQYWYTHSPVTEVVFLWENSFSFEIATD